MSVNSSSSSSSYVCPFDIELSSFNSSSFLGIRCYVVRPNSLAFAMFNITSILLLLPLCSFVIYLGLQRWRQQRSSTTATISHSDSFTYHMVAIELAGVLGNTFCLYGLYHHHFSVVELGFLLSFFTWTGQMFFHMLTCLERYLAVVHPITYLSLRKERGIRIRNIINGCAWLLCIICSCLYLLKSTILDAVIFSVFFVIVIFCSLSVFRVLTGSGPGEQVGGRGRVDQSKQRAFHTMLFILGVLLMRFCWILTWFVVSSLKLDCECSIAMVDFWCDLPSNLLLPVLYLHKAGKLGCCKKDVQ